MEVDHGRDWYVYTERVDHWVQKVPVVKEIPTVTTRLPVPTQDVVIIETL